MLDLASIVRTVLKEHELGPAPHARACQPPTPAALLERIQSQLADPASIPRYARTSAPLSLVRFRCLLQDTGYPAEVYLPAAEQRAEVAEPDGARRSTDWSALRERWVGWAVELAEISELIGRIPGEQPWAKGAVARAEADSTTDQMAALSVASTTTLEAVYDGDASFKPASAYDVIGIVSHAALPSPLGHDDDDDDGNGEAPLNLVPAIHAVAALEPAHLAAQFTEPSSADELLATRTALLDTLAQAFEPPDETAAALLLLVALSSPAVRPTALQPLGTLALNLLRPAAQAKPVASAPAGSSAQAALTSLLSSLLPAVLPLDLSLRLLHTHPFTPASTDSASLAAGLLQLAPGTLLVVDEDHMGAGGQLSARALSNLQALAETVEYQRVGYSYPFMDALKMDAAVRALVVSEGKSLLPMDVHLPVSLGATGAAPSPAELDSARRYLSAVSSAAHAAKLVIPDAVATTIQDTFVADRQTAVTAADGANAAAEAAARVARLERAEARLKRRMRLARLVALSYPAAELSPAVWDETVKLDQEIERRNDGRDGRQRDSHLGQPTQPTRAAT